MVPYGNIMEAEKIIILLTLLLASMGPNWTVGAYQTSSATSVSSSSSSSSSSSITGSVIRLRANKLRRPEICRDNLPRKSEDLPVLVITGRVKEVYLAGESQINQQQQAPAAATSSLLWPNLGQDFNFAISSNNDSNSSNGQNQNNNNNKALVNIGRVIKGNQQLVGSDIIVSGFNSSNANPCPNYVKPNDTWIMLLNHDGDRKYSIQGNNILSLNLNNLDRINAIATDDSYKRRPIIEDILCEAHYCAYGRCVVNDQTIPTVSCQCPESCGPLPSPVCGSDNATYANECHLIKEGCRRQRPLFVTKEFAC